MAAASGRGAAASGGRLVHPGEVAYVDLGQGRAGPEWAKVLEVETDEWELAWHALKEGVRDARIETVRSSAKGGVTCGVTAELTIGERAGPVVSAWHYAARGTAPRLVTAYPTAYNRAHGSKE
jgi:hypothetical protein